MFLYYVIRGIATAFIRVFFPYKSIGKENACKGPCVIVSNHLSNADSFIVGMQYKGKNYVLGKKESFSPKIVGWFLKTVGGIPIDRDSPDAATIINCVRLLKKGNRLLIFPEGTRNKTDEILLPLKSGAALLAIKSKVPVQTVFIEGKSRLFRRNYVKVGETFELSEFYGLKLNSETLKQADDIIREKLLETSRIPTKKQTAAKDGK